MSARTRRPQLSAQARLAEIPGIGNTLARKLVRRGIKTRAQLRTIIDELPLEAQVHLRYNVSRSIPLAVGKTIVAEMKRRLVYAGHRKYPLIAVGSVRRETPVLKDIDILVVVPDDTDLQNILSSAELREPSPSDVLSIVESYASGVRRRSFVVRYAQRHKRPKYYDVDLFLATKGEKPYALFHYSNGRNYNIRIRAHAKRRGLKLDQYGLYVAGTKKKAPGSANIKTERDLTRFLGVTYRQPKDRTNA